MITEDYVSFEVAKLLKDKGFDAECLGTYSTGDKELSISSECPYSNDLNDDMFIAAPTLQMAIKWFREIHDKNIVLDMVSLDEDCYVLWTYNVYCNKNYKIMWGPKQPKYNTYEEACEEAIKYCLEHLI